MRTYRKFDRIIDRFWSQTAVEGTCLVWMGSLNNQGRPQFGVKQSDGRWKITLAYRWLYEQVLGAIPNGFETLHSCDNGRCVALQHLTVGTHSQNMIDMMHKGRRRYPTGRESPSARLSSEQLEEIRRKHCGGVTQVALAKEYGVWRRTIYKILKGAK